MEQIRECPFCGGEAEYNEKEERIECRRCKARVWFDANPGREEYIKSEFIRKWNERTKDMTIGGRLYALSMEKSTQFQISLLNMAKYGGLVDSLVKAKGLIREIKTEIDGVDISDEVLKVIESLDHQREQPR